MHRDLAVHKIMEAMCTANTKSGTQSLTCLKLHMRQMIMEGTGVLWKESAHPLRTFYFTESFDEPSGKGAFEMRHSFIYFFSLVHNSEFCMQTSRPLACGIRISSKSSATSGLVSSSLWHPLFRKPNVMQSTLAMAFCQSKPTLPMPVWQMASYLLAHLHKLSTWWAIKLKPGSWPSVLVCL